MDGGDLGWVAPKGEGRERERSRGEGGADGGDERGNSRMVELCKKYLRPQEDRIKKVQDISVLEFSSASVETLSGTGR